MENKSKKDRKATIFSIDNKKEITTSTVPENSQNGYSSSLPDPKRNIQIVLDD